MARPAGVTILGILAAIGGVLALAFGLFFLFGSKYLVQLTGMPNFIASIAMIAATGGIAIGLIDFAIAYGFFTLANWARILAMICAVLSLAGTVYGSVRAYARFEFYPLPRQMLLVVVDLLILWYLSRPRVKQAFARIPAAAQPPAASATPSASA